MLWGEEHPWVPRHSTPGPPRHKESYEQVLIPSAEDSALGQPHPALFPTPRDPPRRHSYGDACK